MKQKKGKQLIGMLACLIIGGAALGLGISRGILNNAGGILGSIQIRDRKSVV